MSKNSVSSSKKKKGQMTRAEREGRGTEHLDEDVKEMLQENGDFMTRCIPQFGCSSIFVTVLWKNHLLNAEVKKKNGSYEMNDVSNPSIKQLIDDFQVDGVTAILIRPIFRKHWQLRHRMIKLGKKLGQGCYGVVYQGTLTYRNKAPIKVAIKSLTKMGLEASNELWTEARVVKMYGVANDQMPFYLVVELVPGGSVDEFLKKADARGGCSKMERAEILMQAARGLEYLHSKGCIHRDIATRNLLIDNSKKDTMIVKVSDFGMTKKSKNFVIDPEKPLNLRWMDPEVFSTKIVNQATDVYAYGITMYETYTQPFACPYEDWSAERVMYKVSQENFRLKPLPLMSREIRELYLECIGPSESRPTFRAIVLCLDRTIRNKKV